MNIFDAVVPFVLGLFIGGFVVNYVGDSKTMTNCAMRGEAGMMSGGSVICTPKGLK